mmetsp:Transcript_22231/g.69648  ORF Transcript_22231/g.69648 Transcript_22231/m.69648 type:complete len:216 (+) Transcript_22231:1057-1704(+)
MMSSSPYLLQAGADANCTTEFEDGPYAGQRAPAPLAHACARNRPPMAQTLICFGAHVNAQDENGFTYLEMACMRGHTDIVEVLLEQGADYTKAQDRIDVISLAEEKGHDATVAALRAFPPLARSLERRTCAYCGQKQRALFEPTLKVCAGCRCVRYCSRSCQKRAWSRARHREVCRKMAELRVLFGNVTPAEAQLLRGVCRERTRTETTAAAADG